MVHILAQFSRIFRAEMTEKSLDTVKKDKHGDPEWTCLYCPTSAGCVLEYGTYLIERHENLNKIASEYHSGYSSWRCVVKCPRKQSYLENKFEWNICDMYTTSRGKRYLWKITAAIFWPTAHTSVSSFISYFDIVIPQRLHLLKF